MDIGPVSAIRPVPAVRPSPPGSEQNQDLTGVFAPEFRDQQQNDSYSPSRQPDRGLEDENTEDETPSSPDEAAQGNINIFV